MLIVIYQSYEGSKFSMKTSMYKLEIDYISLFQ